MKTGITSFIQACLISAFTFLFVVSAHSREVTTLKHIEVLSEEHIEQVVLEFDGKYTETPLINFEPGSVNLHLKDVSIDPVLPSLLLPDSSRLIKAVRAFQTPNAPFVNLEIIFQSAGLLLEHPGISIEGNTMILNLHLNSVPQQTVLSNTNLLTKEVGQRVREDAAFPSTFSRETPAESVTSEEDFLFQPDRDWVTTMVTLVLSLLFILLLIYLLAYLYNRFLAGRFPTLQGKIKIRIVSTFHVAPKQKVVVLEINEKYFACGVTPTTINLLAELDHPGDQSFLQDIRPNTPGKQIDVDRSRAEFLRTLERARSQVNVETASAKAAHPETQTPTTQQEAYVPEDHGSSEDAFNAQESPGTVSSASENSSFNTPIRGPISFHSPDSGQDTPLNPAIQDFANRLSERLKSLKPIK